MGFRALEEGVGWCQEEMTVDAFLGCSWPGLPRGKMFPLTVRLMGANGKEPVAAVQGKEDLVSLHRHVKAFS